MSNLKQQLIRLGSKRPSLRSHLRPILDVVTSSHKTAVLDKVDEGRVSITFYGDPHGEGEILFEFPKTRISLQASPQEIGKREDDFDVKVSGPVVYGGDMTVFIDPSGELLLLADDFTVAIDNFDSKAKESLIKGDTVTKSGEVRVDAQSRKSRRSSQRRKKANSRDEIFKEVKQNLLNKYQMRSVGAESVTVSEGNDHLFLDIPVDTRGRGVGGKKQHILFIGYDTYGVVRMTADKGLNGNEGPDEILIGLALEVFDVGDNNGRTKWIKEEKVDIGGLNKNEGVREVEKALKNIGLPS